MRGLDLKPRIGSGPFRARKGRILFICYYDPNFIATVVENIGMWQRLSEYDLAIFNLWPNRNPLLTLPASLDLKEFDGVLIHSTAGYAFANLQSLDTRLATRFADYDGVKVLMKQDEQVKPGRVARYLGENKFDLLITCMPEAEVRKVYPASVVGQDLAFLHAYTGYISPAQHDLWHRYRKSERPIDISYRGSVQPLETGRLGFEKRKVGYDVAALPHRSGANIDISSRNEDRIGGTAWFDFLASSKVVLGVESGSNLFDFEGEVEAWCRDYAARNADVDPLSERYYVRAHEEHLHKFEGNVNYAQISPRHLEAACAGAVQMLYEGEYSNRLRPYEHYVPLRRDLGNWAEARDFIEDPKARAEMAERAYNDIVLNRDLQYAHFVDAFDRALDSVFEKKRERRAAGPTFGSGDRPRVLLLVPHDPVQDPRIGWWANQLSQHADVCELGLYHTAIVGEGPSMRQVSPSRIQVRVERTRHDWPWPVPETVVTADAGAAALANLRAFEKMPKRDLARAVGALGDDGSRLSTFDWYVTYFVDISSALIQAGRNLGSFDVIIASDLDTLAAGVSLSATWNADLLYDAHEYWPYAFVNFDAWECQFWSHYEAGLVAHADRRVAVSPQLADIMGHEYGLKFDSVPNCAPLADGRGVDVSKKSKDLLSKHRIDFLFQGGFSDGRGLAHLIQAWVHVAPPTRLLLRGPDSPYKAYCIELAKALGVYNTSVFFPEPVSEAELVRAAAKADVGVVPYEPINVNNRNASPNKLSQYMAAGLPILCNTMVFVADVVTRAAAGRVIEFHDHAALARAVNDMVADRAQLARQSAASVGYFQKHFHFEEVARDTLNWIDTRLDARRDEPRHPIDLSWIDTGPFMRRISAANNSWPSVITADAVASSLTVAPNSASSAPVHDVQALTQSSPRTLGGLARRVLMHRYVRQAGRAALGAVPPKVRERLKTSIVKWVQRQS